MNILCWEYASFDFQKKKKYHGPQLRETEYVKYRLLDYWSLDDGLWDINYQHIQKIFRLKQPTSLEVHKTLTGERIGCEMIESQRGAYRRVGHNQLISNKREWNNCFIKNNQEILLDLADLSDLALHEQPEDNLMVAISRAWYNGII